MARLIAGIAEKHKLSPRPIIVVNKSGGAGAEGFLHVKGKKGDAHTIIITLSNLFTTPLHTGVPFNWKDLDPGGPAGPGPVHPLGQRRSALQDREGVPGGGEGASGGDRMKMAGTGSAQEDQIITIQVEQALGVKFTYVPFKGGGEVCVNLVGQARGLDRQQPDRMRRPLEGRPRAAAGRCSIPSASRMPSGRTSPTVKEALGLTVSYNMLRGIFGPPDMPKEAAAWYQGFLKKVMDTPEFKDYLAKGALKAA